MNAGLLVHQSADPNTPWYEKLHTAGNLGNSLLSLGGPEMASVSFAITLLDYGSQIWLGAIFQQVAESETSPETIFNPAVLNRPELDR